MILQVTFCLTKPVACSQATLSYESSSFYYRNYMYILHRLSLLVPSLGICQLILEGSPLMWMMHLHVNLNADDDVIFCESGSQFNSSSIMSGQFFTVFVKCHLGNLQFPRHHSYFRKISRCLQGFPGLKIESLRLPKCCLGLSTNNLEGPTGLLKIVKEFTFTLIYKKFFLNNSL